MSRRGLVILLAAVIAAAVAIPALADSGTTAKSASVRGLSKRALAKAKLSLRLSRGAKRLAHRAAGNATAALSASTVAKNEATQAFAKAASAREVAGGANFIAEQAKEAVAATRGVIGFAEGSKSTGSETFVKLGEGPAVTVTVPSSGLIQVWAQAKVSDGGVVSLYEDGHPVAGQANCFGEPEPPEEETGVLFASPGGGEGGEGALTIGTPASLPLCSTLGPPGPVMFQSTLGPHTFELRYAFCGCSGTEVTFSERRLVVQPLP
jgi:hypothetical protein